MQKKSTLLKGASVLMLASALFVAPAVSSDNQQVNNFTGNTVAQAKVGSKLVAPNNLKANDITIASKSIQNKTYKLSKKTNLKMFLTKSVRTNSLKKGRTVYVLYFTKYKNVKYAYVSKTGGYEKGKLGEGYIPVANLVEAK